jgi:4-hydroxy-tetrahydrodipicolinate reductase
MTLLKNIQEATSGLTPVFGRDEKGGRRTATEIGMHAVRGGTIVGRHDVIFAGHQETIELRHNAESKDIFAKGSVLAAKFLVKQDKGLYNMNDLYEARQGLK